MIRKIAIWGTFLSAIIELIFAFSIANDKLFTLFQRLSESEIKPWVILLIHGLFVLCVAVYFETNDEEHQVYSDKLGIYRVNINDVKNEIRKNRKTIEEMKQELEELQEKVNQFK